MAAAVTPFAALFNPIGVATDDDGSVLVSHDRVSHFALSKLGPSGQIQGEVAFPGVLSGSAHLDFASRVDLAVASLPDGRLFVVDPDGLKYSQLLNLRTMGQQGQVDTSDAYDISTGRFGNVGHLILPQRAHYGDVAVFEREGTVDLFVSGVSVGFPFVTRIRVDGQGATASVVAASSATTAPDNGQPRGVAVNDQGVVLTTLPINGGTVLGNHDVGVSFGADFPESRAHTPQIRLGGKPISSRGMTTDDAGNFYVATGSLGAQLDGTVHSSGVIVAVSRDFQRFEVQAMSSNPHQVVGSTDVAIDSGRGVGYVALATNGMVARFALGSIGREAGRTDTAEGMSVFRQGTWYLDFDGAGGRAERSLSFGVGSDVPVVGDWDRDGVDEPAVFRNGTWFFDLKADGGVAEKAYAFGISTDVPVAGDFNGDGRADVGVFRNGIWFFDLDGAGGAAEKALAFGIHGDRPVAGDFDGDGRTDIGVFRHGTWYLDLDGRGGAAEKAFAFGIGSDRPVVGDLNGDGISDAGVYRDGVWFFDLDGVGGGAEFARQFGIAGDVPLAGRWSSTGTANSYGTVPLNRQIGGAVSANTSDLSWAQQTGSARNGRPLAVSHDAAGGWTDQAVAQALNVSSEMTTTRNHELTSSHAADEALLQWLDDDMGDEVVLDAVASKR